MAVRGAEVRDGRRATPAEAVALAGPPWLRWRVPAVASYVGASLVLVAAFGLPERPYVLAWLLVAIVLVCWRNARPPAPLLIDWLPLLVILTVYEVIRLQADGLIARAHLQPQLDVDTWIGGGSAPTVRLQDALFHPGHLRWYDYAAFGIYLTHFVAAITVGIVLYFVARHLFHRFACVFLACSLAGFATYVIYPAIPPWLASKMGVLAPTTRAVDTIWNHLGVRFLGDVFSGNPKYSNPVGALPSEHGAYPLLFLLLFWTVASKPWRVLLAVYVLVMAFALVYLAEHYVFDILMGWVYAVVAFVLVSKALERRSQRRDLPVAHGTT